MGRNVWLPASLQPPSKMCDGAAAGRNTSGLGQVLAEHEFFNIEGEAAFRYGGRIAKGVQSRSIARCRGGLMDFAEMGAFEAAYRRRSINKAAGELFMTPQGVSKAVHRLEAELDCPLFCRSWRGLEPAMAAERLYPIVRDLVEECASIRDGLTSVGDCKTLEVPCVSGTLSLVGLRFAEGFEGRCPGSRLSLVEATNAGVLRSLSDGLSKVAVAVGPLEYKDFDTALLASEPHMLVVSLDDPLAGKDAVSYRDLDGRTIILLSREYPVMETLTRKLSAAGAVPTAMVGASVLSDVLNVMRSNGRKPMPRIDEVSSRS